MAMMTIMVMSFTIPSPPSGRLRRVGRVEEDEVAVVKAQVSGHHYNHYNGDHHHNRCVIVILSIIQLVMIIIGQSVTFRFRNFFYGIGFGNFWYRKKYRYRFRKKIGIKKSIGIGY